MSRAALRGSDDRVGTSFDNDIWLASHSTNPLCFEPLLRWLSRFLDHFGLVAYGVHTLGRTRTEPDYLIRHEYTRLHCDQQDAYPGARRTRYPWPRRR